VTTTTRLAPASATSSALAVKVSVSASTNVVGRCSPFQYTTELGMKRVPRTVNIIGRASIGMIAGSIESTFGSGLSPGAIGGSWANP